MFYDSSEYIDDYLSEPDVFLDVPFVPSDETVVDAMLKLARVGPRDLIYDLGSGDGRILITAARKRSARGIGIDIDPQRIADAMEEAGYAGVERLVDFVEENLFDADISAATVVTLYLLESVNIQLRPRLLSELRPGTRIVSHAFDMGDWRADDWIKLNGVNIYKWIVPARVAGDWEWTCHEGRSYQLQLDQKYQDVTGKAWLDGSPAQLEVGGMDGNRLDLTIGEGGGTSQTGFALVFEDGNLTSVTPLE